MAAPAAAGERVPCRSEARHGRPFGRARDDAAPGLHQPPHALERELDPGEPNSLNMYDTTADQRAELGIEALPANLLEAANNAERCDVLRKAFGSVGEEDYLDYYVRCKRRDWRDGHEQVTQWELDRYLQLF